VDRANAGDAAGLTPVRWSMPGGAQLRCAFGGAGAGAAAAPSEGGPTAQNGAWPHNHDRRGLYLWGRRTDGRGDGIWGGLPGRGGRSHGALQFRAHGGQWLLIERFPLLANARGLQGVVQHSSVKPAMRV